MGGSLLFPLLAALAAVPVPRTLTVSADTRLLWSSLPTRTTKSSLPAG